MITNVLNCLFENASVKLLSLIIRSNAKIDVVWIILGRIVDYPLLDAGISTSEEIFVARVRLRSDVH